MKFISNKQNHWLFFSYFPEFIECAKNYQYKSNPSCEEDVQGYASILSLRERTLCKSPILPGKYHQIQATFIMIKICIYKINFYYKCKMLCLHSSYRYLIVPLDWIPPVCALTYVYAFCAIYKKWWFINLQLQKRYVSVWIIRPHSYYLYISKSWIWFMRRCGILKTKHPKKRFVRKYTLHCISRFIEIPARHILILVYKKKMAYWREQYSFIYQDIPDSHLA